MGILAIDQGTTGTTTVLYDAVGRPVRSARRAVRQIYPRPGWVEHDPEDIWAGVVSSVEEVCQAATERIDAIGITNQRETTIVWDRLTGRPVHNAIVWQCRRTADLCRMLQPHAERIRDRTGLPLDAYFSGTKLKWLLEHAASQRAPRDLAFGTVDTWLAWKLTGGGVHATDYTNASRTMLFNIDTMQWDTELCALLGVPMELLPEVRASAGDFGEVAAIPALKGTPILGAAGDQQAALFGQTGFARGAVKNTYGTGCFLLMNTGATRPRSEHGLITTLAIDGTGAPCYALEGSVFIAGAAIQWLRDELDILEDAAASDAAARALNGNDGVYLVPAFTGLGAPYWDMDARGTLVGLTRGTTRNHLVRAALEAMAYQCGDVFRVMEDETQVRAPVLAVDGGAAANDFLMQFQADMLDRPVERPAIVESTSLGAAFLAGLKAGVWRDSGELAALRTVERRFNPAMPAAEREGLLEGWRHAVRQTVCR